MNTLLKNTPDTFKLRMDIKTSALTTRMLREERRKTLARTRKMRAKGYEGKGLHALECRAERLIWQAEDCSQRDRFLALGFLRGHSYKALEKTCRVPISTASIIPFLRPCISKNDLSDTHLKIALGLWLQGHDLSDSVADIEYQRNLAALQSKVVLAKIAVTDTNKAIEKAQEKVRSATKYIEASKETVKEKDAAVEEARQAMETLKRQGPPSSQDGDPLENIKAVAS